MRVGRIVSLLILLQCLCASYSDIVVSGNFSVRIKDTDQVQKVLSPTPNVIENSTTFPVTEDVTQSSMVTQNVTQTTTETSPQTTQTPTTTETLLTTPEAPLAPSSYPEEMRKYMDFSADPCQNFYQFACGNFEKNRSKSENTSQITPLSLLKDKVDRELQVSLKNDFTIRRNDSYAKVINFYNKCVEQKNKNSTMPANLLIEEIEKLGGWPPIYPFRAERWDKFSFNSALQKIFTKFGASPFFKIGIMEKYDKIGTLKYKIRISPPNLGISDLCSYSSNTEYAQHKLGAYWTYITSFIELLQTDYPHPYKNKILDTVATDIISFETMLAEILVNSNKTEMDVQKTINSMDNEMIDWFALLNTYFDGGLTSNTEIHLDNAYYLEKMAELLFLNINIEQMSSYMMWVLVNSFAKDLGPEYERLHRNWMKANQIDLTKVDIGCLQKKECKTTTSGLSHCSVEDMSYVTDGQQCLRQTKEFMGTVLSALFVDGNFPNDEPLKEAQSEVGMMIYLLMHRISTNELMDNETKDRATQKLEMVKVKCGYPEWLHDAANLNGSRIERYYEKLGPITDLHLSNVIKLRNFQRIKRAEKFHRGLADRDEWPENLFAVDVEYNLERNELFVPAGILSPAGGIFSQDFHNWNIGALTRYIGPALFSAIDFDQGRGWQAIGALDLGREMISFDDYFPLDKQLYYTQFGQTFCYSGKNLSQFYNAGQEDFYLNKTVWYNAGFNEAFYCNKPV